VLGVEQHAVVLPDRVVLVVVDLRADRDDAPRQRRDLDLVGQVQARLGLLLVLVLADQDPAADRLDDLEGLGRGLAWCRHAAV
jgi:hypothetical protein